MPFRERHALTCLYLSRPVFVLFLKKTDAKGMGWMNSTFRVQRDGADGTATRNSSGLIGDNADEHLIFLKRCKTIFHLICVAESFLFKNSFVLLPRTMKDGAKAINLFSCCVFCFFVGPICSTRIILLSKRRERCGKWILACLLPSCLATSSSRKKGLHLRNKCWTSSKSKAV